MKLFIRIFVLSFVSLKGIAQTIPPLSYPRTNTIETAVPFLMITPDARAAGMGETGVATSPDVNSIHWNAAKLAFADKKFALGISYTPWLRSLVPDANHAYISAYFKPDSISAIGISARYFSMGEVTLSGVSGIIGQYRPREFAFDACYSRRFAKYWSAGIAARFIYSNQTGGITLYGQDTHAGKAVAGDLGIYYNNPDHIKILGKKNTMMLGVAITNIGSKISYATSSYNEFIPINLRIGQGLSVRLDSKNNLALQYELNKLLVPSLQTNGSGQNVSVPYGMLHSFSDSPDGFKGEMREIILSTGLEYSYNKIFFARAGYFHESHFTGNLQYATLGGGIKYNMFALDFAYLIPTNWQRNPLENTLRFSLIIEISKMQIHQMKTAG